MIEEYDEFDGDDGDDLDDFDCHLDPTTGLCGAAGSEDCEFECPHRTERDRIRARVVADRKGSTGINGDES